MRKFSVLLVICIFFVPVFVYGFTVKDVPQRISRDISTFVKSQKNSIGFTKIRTIFSETSLGILHKTAETEDKPTILFPEPFGAKGVVESVDLEKRMIILKNARCYNELANGIIISDLTVYVTEMTNYTKDVDQIGSLDIIRPNDVIICSGLINFTDKTIKETFDIFQGRLIDPNMTASVNFSSPISNFDAVNKTFEFLYPCNGQYPGEGQTLTLKVLVNAETRIFTVKAGAKDSPSEFKFGEIPQFVKTGTFMNGVFVVNQDLTAVANILYFFEQ